MQLNPIPISFRKSTDSESYRTSSLLVQHVSQLTLTAMIDVYGEIEKIVFTALKNCYTEHMSSSHEDRKVSLQLKRMLEIQKKQIQLFKKAKSIKPWDSLNAEYAAIAHMIANMIGVKLESPGNPPRLSLSERSNAASYAKHRVKDAHSMAEKYLYNELLPLYSQFLKSIPWITAEMALHAPFMTEALHILETFSSKARTPQVRAALQAAIVLREPVPHIWEQVEKEESDKFLKDTQPRITRTIALIERKLMLSAVADEDFDPESAAANRLLWAALRDTCGVADNGLKFLAFKGAASLPLLEPHYRVVIGADGELCVSKAVQGDSQVLPLQISNVTATLSAHHLLCAHGRDEDESDQLYLYDFLTRKSVLLGVPNILWACAYDGELFVGVLGDLEVYCAPVLNVLEGFAFENFLKFKVPKRMLSAAADRAADGWVVFCSDDNTLVRINLRTKTCDEIQCDIKLSSINGLTGIRVPHVLCVARNTCKGHVVVVFYDGKTEKLCDAMYGCPALIPSEASPGRLSHAAFIDARGTMVYNKKKITLKKLSPSFRSLVRLHKDVFMCYNPAKKTHIVVKFSFASHP
eukprot:gnl/Chilomastix_cuspidata/3166.p1 GENE.gnl/Chilomastix_cuspidata/3166~~gnl/Chilomastix_cuspidata/3166.p1  ORF type:complete len:581 (-),score=79.95 gnl/Chilomastix_cuspidata/3166:77-1819(-)